MEKPESTAVEFIYQDTEIHFLLGNEKNVMVNATEMGNIFGKLSKDFLKNETTKAFIKECLKKENSPFLGIEKEEDLYVSKQKSGTYFHRILALKFAGWLDPSFELWVYSKIEEVLFGKAKAVGNKISEAELKKEKIKKLIKEARESGNETAIAILDSLDELKVIEKEKKKSMAQFSSQFKMEFN
jgi:hypothetical protein